MAGENNAVTRPRTEILAVVLGADDVGELARFYERLLGWPIAVDQGDWAIVRDPDGGTGISIQEEPDHIPPVWPPVSGKQQMMIHLDIGVDDLDAGVTWAVAAGATIAGHQPQNDVRVMLDPAGHPFCLFPVNFDEL